MDNILIVGRGAKISAIARKLKNSKDVGKIFAASGNGVEEDYYQNIDIREDDLTGLLKFALENDVKLTIAASEKSINADIAEFFNDNGQNIFAPACKDFFNRINVKKFLYKIRTQCPKFGAFSRLQDAISYLDEAVFPIIVESAQHFELENDRFLCPSRTHALKFLNDLSQKGVTDFLIEEYTYGKNFTVYYITDGYSAVPFGSVCTEKLDKNGFLTGGIECLAPNFHIPETAFKTMQGIANRIIKYFEQRNMPYLGILGLEGTLTENNAFVVGNIKTFLDNIDAAAVLNLCAEDFYKIMQSCVNGFFSDEYDYIETNALNCASARQKGKIPALVDENESVDCINPDEYILTCTAATPSRAIKLRDAAV